MMLNIARLIILLLVALTYVDLMLGPASQRHIPDFDPKTPSKKTLPTMTTGDINNVRCTTLVLVKLDAIADRGRCS